MLIITKLIKKYYKSFAAEMDRSAFERTRRCSDSKSSMSAKLFKSISISIL